MNSLLQLLSGVGVVLATTPAVALLVPPLAYVYGRLQVCAPRGGLETAVWPLGAQTTKKAALSANKNNYFAEGALPSSHLPTPFT